MMAEGSSWEEMTEENRQKVVDLEVEMRILRHMVERIGQEKRTCNFDPNLLPANRLIYVMLINAVGIWCLVAYLILRFGFHS